MALHNHEGRRICYEDLPSENSPAFTGSSTRPEKRLNIIWQEDYSVREDKRLQAITDTKVKIKLMPQSGKKPLKNQQLM